MPTRRISRIAPFSTNDPFLVRGLGPQGRSEWDFKLNHVYTVALLNFSMNDDAFDKEKIRHHVQLCDTATHKVFYDKRPAKMAYRDIKNSGEYVPPSVKV